MSVGVGITEDAKRKYRMEAVARAAQLVQAGCLPRGYRTPADVVGLADGLYQFIVDGTVPTTADDDD